MNLPQVLSIGNVVYDIAAVGIVLLHSQTVTVIEIVCGLVIVGDAFQPSALSPGEVIPVTVVIGQRIADIIVSNRLVIQASQQVCPAGSRGVGDNIRVAVLGVLDTTAVIKGQKIAGIIVGVGLCAYNTAAKTSSLLRLPW